MPEKPDISEDLFLEAAAKMRRVQTADPESLDELVTWLAADPRHAIAYAQVQDVWEAFEDHPASPEMLRLRQSVLGKAEASWRRRLSTSGVDRRAVLGAAAASIVAATTAGLIYFRPWHRQQIVTEIGEQRIAQLADGSKVTVDANSHLSIDFQDNSRNLRVVAGRAHFQVAKDPSRPFNVAAGSNTVTAIGTAFSVEVRKQRIAVTLFEGRIQVAGNDARTLRRHVFNEVKPSQQLILDGRADTMPQYKTIDERQELGWQQSQLFFDATPLSEVADRMNDYSTRKIVVQGGANEIRVSGMYLAGQTDAFVDALEKVYPVRADVVANTVLISPRT